LGGGNACGVVCVRKRDGKSKGGTSNPPKCLARGGEGAGRKAWLGKKKSETGIGKKPETSGVIRKEKKGSKGE